MPLEPEFFDAIHIDVVKRKYYNANKVQAVYTEIRRQAAELNAENAWLRTQLAALDDKKVELGDAVLSAQMVYRQIIDKANERAEAIVREAERERDEILAQSQAQQEHAVESVKACFDLARRQHEEAIEALNAQWQAYLCGLYPEGEGQPENPCEPSAEELSAKVGAIAEEMFAIGENK